MVCDFSVQNNPEKKRKFKPCIRTWKLRKAEHANEFYSVFKDKITDETNPGSVSETEQAVTESTNQVENLWTRLKSPLLEAANEVCGLSKKHQWKRETWWWN